MECYCSGACCMIVICIMQLLTISARQAFDFLGFQWAAIVVNFCQIGAVILGLAGAYRQKRRLIAVYATWSLIWLGWNSYIVFLYLGIGDLKLEEHMISLNLGLNDNYSWFKLHPFGCAANPNLPSGEFCIYRFQYIEIYQSSVQLLLGVIGFSFACYTVGIMKEDERNFDLQMGYHGSIGSHKVGEDVNDNGRSVQPLVGSTLHTSSTV
uniref:Sodium/potassium-transporting ATPase subunit beta-1-interacting protein n=1 Tax=Ciona savignyi TaxID=51511 RepID=H2Y6M3_CIOSA